MADDRLQRAWREWVSTPTNERAQAYCVETARSSQAPCKATTLGSIFWSEFGPLHVEARNAIYGAAKRFLTTEPEEACIEALHWLTRFHYRFLGDARPVAVDLIAKIYEDHGMELKDGTQAEALRDMRLRLDARERGSENYETVKRENERLAKIIQEGGIGD